MKNHELHLNKSPFEIISNGIKDVEYRLNDEKRQLIEVGDTIVFYKKPENTETIKVLVTDLKYYKTLLDMYTDSFDKYLKDMYKEPQEAVDDTDYYSDEEIEKYGCLAIHFKKI